MQQVSHKFAVVVMAALLTSVPARLDAAIFIAEVSVEADDNGVVVINGGEGIELLTQYCPEEWKDGCANNVNIKRQGNKFVLDKDGLAEHQSAFNFRDSSGKWLSLPDRKRVIVGRNVDQVKGFFVYTGPTVK